MGRFPHCVPPSREARATPQRIAAGSSSPSVRAGAVGGSLAAGPIKGCARMKDAFVTGATVFWPTVSTSQTSQDERLQTAAPLDVSLSRADHASTRLVPLHWRLIKRFMDVVPSTGSRRKLSALTASARRFRNEISRTPFDLRTASTVCGAAPVARSSTLSPRGVGAIRRLSIGCSGSLVPALASRVGLVAQRTGVLSDTQQRVGSCDGGEDSATEIRRKLRLCDRGLAASTRPGDPPSDSLQPPQSKSFRLRLRRNGPVA